MKRGSKDNLTDILMGWTKVLGEVAEDEKAKESEFLSAIKASTEWPKIEKVASWVLAEETLEIGEKNPVPFGCLKPGRQAFYVNIALGMLKTHARVERALGRLIDDESSRTQKVVDKIEILEEQCAKKRP